MWGDMSKCEETSSYGFPVLYSYGQYKRTAASLGIDKMKKLVKMMIQMTMIKLVSVRSMGPSGIQVRLRLPRTEISLKLPRYSGQP